jgi:hypothetical protein
MIRKPKELLRKGGLIAKKITGKPGPKETIMNTLVLRSTLSTGEYFVIKLVRLVSAIT